MILPNIFDGVSGCISPPKAVVNILFEPCHLLPRFNFNLSCWFLNFFSILSVVLEIYILLSPLTDLVSFSLIPIPLINCVVLFIVIALVFQSISFQVKPS